MLDQILNAVSDCKRCVVLTGAGISAESGVPTFRGKEGLWGKFRPEELATMEAFMANPKIVWEWYNWRRELIGEVKPNPGHYAIAEMENIFDHFTLITQNVDDLHRIAGSTNILELHGNIMKNKCLQCSESFPDDQNISPDEIPVCSKCGGQIRPDVVWFGEMLDSAIIQKAYDESAASDLFLSIGTSAIVQPAASLPVEAKRSQAILIEINVNSTPLTSIADFFVTEPSGEFLPKLAAGLKDRNIASR